MDKTLKKENLLFSGEITLPKTIRAGDDVWLYLAVNFLPPHAMSKLETTCLYFYHLLCEKAWKMRCIQLKIKLEKSSSSWKQTFLHSYICCWDRRIQKNCVIYTEHAKIAKHGTKKSNMNYYRYLRSADSYQDGVHNIYFKIFTQKEGVVGFGIVDSNFDFKRQKDNDCENYIFWNVGIFYDPTGMRFHTDATNSFSWWGEKDSVCVILDMTKKKASFYLNKTLIKEFLVKSDKFWFIGIFNTPDSEIAILPERFIPEKDRVIKL